MHDQNIQLRSAHAVLYATFLSHPRATFSHLYTACSAVLLALSLIGSLHVTELSTHGHRISSSLQIQQQVTHAKTVPSYQFHIFSVALYTLVRGVYPPRSLGSTHVHHIDGP